MYTKFRADSSIPFPFIARTHTNNKVTEATDPLAHDSDTGGVGNNESNHHVNRSIVGQLVGLPMSTRILPSRTQGLGLGLGALGMT